MDFFILDWGNIPERPLIFPVTCDLGKLSCVLLIKSVSKILFYLIEITYKGTADAKFAALNDVGVATTNSPAMMGRTMVHAWADKYE